MSNADRQHAYRQRLKIRKQIDDKQRRVAVRHHYEKPSALNMIPGAYRRELAKLLSECASLGHQAGCHCPLCDIERLRQKIGKTWHHLLDANDV